MKHRNILFGLAGLLMALAGGVFILFNQGNSPTKSLSDQGGEIPKEALVAGVSIQEGQEGEEEQIEDSAVDKKVSVQPTLLPSKPTQVAPAPIVDPPIVEQIEESNTQQQDQVPVEEPTPKPTPPAPSPQPVGKVNINTANSGELQQLNGVGPVLASRIIDYRNNTSLYYVIEDIKNVKGIGDVTFNKIKNDIIVGSVSPAPQSPPPAAPQPPPVPTPSPQPTPQPEGHTFYTSSHHASKYYYCDTDSDWENLSPTYLESYTSEQGVLAVYPEKTLHKSCE